MTKNVYMVYFYTSIFPKDVHTFHPYVYFSEVEAEARAKEEVVKEKKKNSSLSLKYRIMPLEIFESNSVNFIKSA